MLAVVFRFEVFVARGADRHDHPDLVARLVDVEAPLTGFDADDGSFLRHFPATAVRIEASDGFDALMRAVAVGFIDAVDFDFLSHVGFFGMYRHARGPEIGVDPLSSLAKFEFPRLNVALVVASDERPGRQ